VCTEFVAAAVAADTAAADTAAADTAAADTEADTAAADTAAAALALSPVPQVADSFLSQSHEIHFLQRHLRRKLSTENHE
jgi:hypothetical protein